MSRAPTVLLLGPPREALGLALEAVGLQPLWMPTLDQARASLSPRSLAALSLPGLNAADAALLAAWQAEGLMAPVVLREERGRSPHIAGLSRIRPLSEAGDEALVRLLLRVARPPAEGRLSLRKGVVDLDGRQLLVAEGPPISLTAREAALLRDVWDAAAGVVSRAVHHTLSRLRAKVELDPAAPDHLRTEPGQGSALPVDIGRGGGAGLFGLGVQVGAQVEVDHHAAADGVDGGGQGAGGVAAHRVALEHRGDVAATAELADGGGVEPQVGGLGRDGPEGDDGDGQGVGGRKEVNKGGKGSEPSGSSLAGVVSTNALPVPTGLVAGCRSASQPKSGSTQRPAAHANPTQSGSAR